MKYGFSPIYIGGISLLYVRYLVFCSLFLFQRVSNIASLLSQSVILGTISHLYHFFLMNKKNVFFCVFLCVALVDIAHKQKPFLKTISRVTFNIFNLFYYQNKVEF